MISDDLLFEVAVDYYIKKLLQKDIAEKYGVSRVQISKYLKMAQDRSIVRIDVIPPRVKSSILTELSYFFKKSFGLKRLVLSNGSRNEKTLMHFLINQTSEYLKTLSRDKVNIGLGWGSTVFNLSQGLEMMERPNWTVIPLSGGTSRLSDKRFNTNHIVQSFADRTGSKAVSMYLPFICENDEQLRNTVNSSEYVNIQELWNTLDVIVCSVGYSIARSPLFREKIFGGSYADEMEKAAVVGDVLTHYFDIDGKLHELEILGRCTNVSIEQYRKAGEKIVVAAGLHKVDGIVGLLRAGLVDTLITDEFTARHVKEYVSEESKGGI